MADRGFTIKDMLKKLQINLNVPPFLDRQKQLQSKQIEKVRKISSLQIHLECANGRIKM